MYLIGVVSNCIDLNFFLSGFLSWIWLQQKLKDVVSNCLLTCWSGTWILVPPGNVHSRDSSIVGIVLVVRFCWWLFRIKISSHNYLHSCSIFCFFKVGSALLFSLEKLSFLLTFAAGPSHSSSISFKTSSSNANKGLFNLFVCFCNAIEIYQLPFFWKAEKIWSFGGIPNFVLSNKNTYPDKKFKLVPMVCVLCQGWSPEIETKNYKVWKVESN